MRRQSPPDGSVFAEDLTESLRSILMRLVTVLLTTFPCVYSCREASKHTRGLRYILTVVVLSLVRLEVQRGRLSANVQRDSGDLIAARSAAHTYKYAHTFRNRVERFRVILTDDVARTKRFAMEESSTSPEWAARASMRYVNVHRVGF